MAESKKGHNFAIQGPTEKIRVRLFFVQMLHIKFQAVKRFSSFTTNNKKGITLSIFHGIRSKVNQVFSSFTTNNNAILVESTKGHNLVNISRNSLKS